MIMILRDITNIINYYNGNIKNLNSHNNSYEHNDITGPQPDEALKGLR